MSTPTSLSKPVINVLEACFGAEIENRLPAQFRGGSQVIDGIPVSAAVKRAHDAGLIEPVVRTMAFNDGLGPMKVRGFALTDAGRFAYCTWAAEQELPDDDD